MSPSKQTVNKQFKNHSDGLISCSVQWLESDVLPHKGFTTTAQMSAQTCSKRRRWEHNPYFSFTFPPYVGQTFWAMLVSHPPCLQSTLALGASNWKRYWGWESSVSSLIPPLGEAHMVSITPNPPQNIGSPLYALSLSISTACSSANSPAWVLFQQFMLLSTHCWVPVLHRGLEMLSPLPLYTVTSKIFHKLDWDWQFGIQRWRLRWSWIGWGREGKGAVMGWRLGKQCK